LKGIFYNNTEIQNLLESTKSGAKRWNITICSRSVYGKVL
jgi:hypothetical protein